MADLLYARWWFTHYGLYTMDRVFFMEENVRRIADQEKAYPDFRDQLRAVALEALGADDERTVRRALSALAIVGYGVDLAAIREVAELQRGAVAKDSGAAEWEITHRVPTT